MKPTKSGDARPPYQQKNGWSLGDHHKEKNSGTSKTVPDQTITIKDLVRRVGAGLDPSISRVAHWGGEESEVDHDDLDLAKAARLDISDAAELLESVRQKQSETTQELEELTKSRKYKKPEGTEGKKGQTKENDKEELDDDLRNDNEEENTSKSSKQSEPKKGTK